MPKRICFLVRHLNDGYSGGAELQVQLYSRALAQRGWNVWVMGEGLRSRKGTRRTKGCNTFSYLLGKEAWDFLTTPTKAALERIRPQVCYQRVKLDYTYWMVKLARCVGSKSLFAFSHDHECLPGALVGSARRLSFPLYRCLADQGIRKADLLLCQTGEQKKLIKANFASEAVIVKNGHPLPGIKEMSWDDQKFSGSIISNR